MDGRNASFGLTSLHLIVTFYAKSGVRDLSLPLSSLQICMESALQLWSEAPTEAIWHGEASKLACAGRAGELEVNARALTEALDIMRDLGSLHATLPLFASTGLVDTFKQLAFHHVRSGPHMPLAPALPHAQLMLKSFWHSSEHHATAGLRPGLKPGLALARASIILVAQGCVAVLALLQHVISWQDSGAEAMRVPDNARAPGEQEAAIAGLAAATLEQWRKVWVHHMEVLLDPAFQADPRSEARTLLKAITDQVGVARCRREPKTPMLASRPQVGGMQSDHVGKVVFDCIIEKPCHVPCHLWAEVSDCDASDPPLVTDIQEYPAALALSESPCAAKSAALRKEAAVRGIEACR